jgi:hypothetical protein
MINAHWGVRHLRRSPAGAANCATETVLDGWLGPGTLPRQAASGRTTSAIMSAAGAIAWMIRPAGKADEPPCRQRWLGQLGVPLPDVM